MGVVVKRFSELPENEIETPYMPDAMLYLLKNGFVRLRLPGNMFASNAIISNFRQAIESLNLTFTDKFSPGYPQYVEYMLTGFEDDRPSPEKETARNPFIPLDGTTRPAHMPFDFVKTVCETNPGKDAKGNYIGADMPPYTAKTSAFVTFMDNAKAIIGDKLGPVRALIVSGPTGDWHPIDEENWKRSHLKYPI